MIALLCVDCATPMTDADWREFSPGGGWLGKGEWRCGCKTGTRGLILRRLAGPRVAVFREEGREP